MNGTEVAVGSGLGEGVRELLISIQRLRFERLVIAYHGVGDIVAVRPSNRGPHRNRYRGRRKAKVVDLHRHFRCGFVIGSGSEGACRARCNNQRRQQECYSKYLLSETHNSSTVKRV